MVDPISVLQFMGSRCAAEAWFQAAYGELQLFGLLDSLISIPDLLPALETVFTAYYQASDTTQMYDLGSGLLGEASIVTLMAAGTYYIVFFDPTDSPTLLLLSPQSGRGRLLSGCSVHLPLPRSAGY
jgi:hypothetical protein